MNKLARWNTMKALSRLLVNWKNKCKVFFMDKFNPSWHFYWMENIAQ